MAEVHAFEEKTTSFMDRIRLFPHRYSTLSGFYMLYPNEQICVNITLATIFYFSVTYAIAFGTQMVKYLLA